MKEKKPFNLKKELLDWGKTILAAVVLYLIISNFLIANASVLTGSMEPTVMTGDRVLCNRLAYIGNDPQRYDIILFLFDQHGVKENYVKRIIGLPGETVKIIDGKVYINNAEEPLPDDFVRVELPMGEYGPYEVPENEFFVLGDNRRNSLDSKSWEYPFVPRKDILGKLFCSYYPNPRMIRDLELEEAPA